jgi:DNA-binding transcriptional regulator YiaG
VDQKRIRQPERWAGTDVTADENEKQENQKFLSIPEELVTRVEGFAAGRQRTRERTVKLPPPVKAMPPREIRAIRQQLGCTQT